MGSNPGGLNMKRIYKKEEGVSPVIATILMVAITVVLAATVWLMVSGYMGSGGGTTVTGSFASKEIVSSGTWKLTFSQFQPDTNISTLKVVIHDGTDNADHTLTFSYNSSYVAVASYTPSGSTTKVYVEYHDLAGNGVINSGDYLLIKHVTQGKTYTVTILDSSGNQVCSTSFTA